MKFYFIYDRCFPTFKTRLYYLDLGVHLKRINFEICPFRWCWYINVGGVCPNFSMGVGPFRLRVAGEK